KGHYLSGGGYDWVAERFFARTEATHFLLEYDSTRAGDFAPLRFVPARKGVVLGLLSSKSPEIESLDQLRRRVDQASAYIGVDRLAISPQCGFASTVAGNPVTEADQRAKLARVVEAAQLIWRHAWAVWEERMSGSRADATRSDWLATLDRFRFDPERPASELIWSPRLDSASRDQLMTIQTEKLRAAVPFLYENSAFYRRRFDGLGLVPTDIRNLDDLAKWPVVDKSEMMADAVEHPPYGTYSTMTDEVWAKRGWMMFSSSGSTGVPRVFRYSHVDREGWAWAN